MMSFCTDWMPQIAVLSYNHNSLAEPALNALNLYADIQ